MRKSLAVLFILACIVGGSLLGMALGQATTSDPRPPERHYTILRGATTTCTLPTGIIDLQFSAAKYPHIKAHTEAAIAKGWPSVLVLDHEGATARRDRLLRGIVDADPTTDRDEYPPALGRLGWLADVAPVNATENRSHGSAMGAKLRGYCDGTRFRFVFV